MCRWIELCLSPQCGFSSTVEGNALTIDDEIAKLRLVVETAREIWGLNTGCSLSPIITIGESQWQSFYRAEVIGSMLRPGYLKETRRNWAEGSSRTRAFKEVEDCAVDDAIALQEKTGVDVISDGEMRRTHFIAPLTDVISGSRKSPPSPASGASRMRKGSRRRKPTSRYSTRWSKKFTVNDR